MYFLRQLNGEKNGAFVPFGTGIRSVVLFDGALQVILVGTTPILKEKSNQTDQQEFAHLLSLLKRSTHFPWRQVHLPLLVFEHKHIKYTYICKTTKCQQTVATYVSNSVFQSLIGRCNENLATYIEVAKTCENLKVSAWNAVWQIAPQ